MNWFSYLTLALKYLPAILQGVTAIEAALPKNTPGPTKKTILMDVIQSKPPVGEGMPAAHLPMVSTLIDTVVKSLNAAGAMPLPVSLNP